MKNSGKARRDDRTPARWTAALSAAILRIGASPDLDAALREAVESVRALTGARFGGITTLDDAGRLQHPVRSGFTPEEQRQLAEWAGGPRLFEHLRDRAETLTVADLRVHVRSLGVAADCLPPGSFQATPMRHGGEHVGNFYLGGKAGGREFTGEDEELLRLFASLAATAIGNARTRDVGQRTRTDLETLHDTSPVGVAVFDAGNGTRVSLNREARRIIDGLRKPGRSAERLAATLTCRFADGREVALKELGKGEPLRAEVAVLTGADGRDIKALVSAGPVGAEGGKSGSTVVTLQDLTPLEQAERQRLEFLGMVSHELRAPLTSIKGSAATVLGASPALDPAEMLQFFRIIDEQANHMRALIGDLLDAGRIDSGTLSVAPQSTDLAVLVDQARTTFLSGGSRHTVLIDLSRDLPRVMADRQRIVQVLNNILANAARHSPEASPIRVAAVRDGAHVAVSVTDEGQGVAPERLPHLFEKYSGESGTEGGHGLGGSGLGLAICKGLVEAHGGRIRASSGGVGEGAQLTFTLPVAPEHPEAKVAPAREQDPLPAERRDPTPILVVDDDPQTLRYVRDALANAGYLPLVTGDHRELPRIVQTEKPRLVVLDLVLPGTDGIELMENVPELIDLPVIFISGYRRDETIARALELGAADYLVKPFSPTELTARIRAVLRRRAESEPFLLGDLAIQYEMRRVMLAGHTVQLTVTEYELLRVLSANAGRITTYDSLIRQVWGGQESGGPELVRTFVKKLRRKLGDDVARPMYIFNERGVGYRMARPDAP